MASDPPGWIVHFFPNDESLRTLSRATLTACPTRTVKMHAPTNMMMSMSMRRRESDEEF